MQINTTMRFHYIPIRMSKKNTDDTKYWQDADQLCLSYFADGNKNWYLTLKASADFFIYIKLSITLP